MLNDTSDLHGITSNFWKALLSDRLQRFFCGKTLVKQTNQSGGSGQYLPESVRESMLQGPWFCEYAYPGAFFFAFLMAFLFSFVLSLNK